MGFPGPRPPHKDRPTIADIAERCGVSIGAVSFALNDRPGVSPATRDRILQTAAEMNWRPHSAARALGRARAGILGVVFNRPARSLGSEAFFGDLVVGLQSGLGGTQLGLMMPVARSLEEELQIYREWAARRGVDGVVLLDPRRSDPRPELMHDLRLPAVVIGSHPSAANMPPAVWIDDRAATELLIDYLYAVGHRRFGHVTGRAEFEHTALRSTALQDFAVERSLPMPLSATTDYSAAAGAEATRRLLSARQRPSVIIFDSDVLAAAGLGVAFEMGIAVPRELSIASFDDSQMARLVQPALTTLTRDTIALGEQAARLLVDQLASDTPLESRPGPSVHLTTRGSTAPPVMQSRGMSIAHP